jgi:NADH-quinone oxidoreductase subunit F
MEGKLGQPRLRPPFPPSFGLYGKPTVVNNVETLTNVPLIVERGAEWYRSIGTEKSPGVKVFSLSGCIEKPGNYELPLGTTFRELIFEHGGGIPNGRQIKAVLPAGESSSLILVNEAALDTPMDYESVPNLGASLGSASIIVIDDAVSIPWLNQKAMHFFKHESCAKCTPCRVGLVQNDITLERMLSSNGQPDDLVSLESLSQFVKAESLCGLGQTACNSILSGLQHFRPEYEALITV